MSSCVHTYESSSYSCMALLHEHVHAAKGRKGIHEKRGASTDPCLTIHSSSLHVHLVGQIDRSGRYVVLYFSFTNLRSLDFVNRFSSRSCVNNFYYIAKKSTPCNNAAVFGHTALFRMILLLHLRPVQSWHATWMAFSRPRER